MEYAVLALPVVLMTALLWLERVERWVDSGGPKTEPAEIKPPPAQPATRSVHRSARTARRGRRRPPVRTISKPATSAAHHPPIQLD
jgi:hypothetical protein